MLSKSRGVKSIDIIAHSMGNWLAMETLRQLAIAGNRDLNGKLGYVVLASPDIDVDIFKKQMSPLRQARQALRRAAFGRRQGPAFLEPDRGQEGARRRRRECG